MASICSSVNSVCSSSIFGSDFHFHSHGQHLLFLGSILFHPTCPCCIIAILAQNVFQLSVFLILGLHSTWLWNNSRGLGPLPVLGGSLAAFLADSLPRVSELVGAFSSALSRVAECQQIYRDETLCNFFLTNVEIATDFFGDKMRQS